jgi:hypothetical protein
MAGASALALGLGMSQASAFDKVAWSWTGTSDFEIDPAIDIAIEIDPSGLIVVEKLQIFVGNSTSTAWLGASINTPAVSYEDGNTYTESYSYWNSGSSISGTWSGEGTVYDEEITKIVEHNNYWGPDYEVPYYNYWDTDTVKMDGTFWGEVGGSHGYGELTYAVPDVLGPDDLPTVKVSAVSLGNSESVDGEDAAVLIHEGQFVFGDANGEWEPPTNTYWVTDISASGETNYWDHLHVAVVDECYWGRGCDIDYGKTYGSLGVEVSDGTGKVEIPTLGANDWTKAKNSNVALADLMLSLVLNGQIEKSMISATSGAGYISGAAADVSAVAIANNHSINVDLLDDEGGLIVADLVQFAYADVSASAGLAAHDLSGYQGLGGVDIVNVSAVAAGNVSNITLNTAGLADDD